MHAEIGARSADQVKRRLLESMDHTVRELFSDDVFRAARRIETLEFVARALGLDASTLHITWPRRPGPPRAIARLGPRKSQRHREW